MSYRNVVWDMGGTLFDTYPEIDELFAAEVAATGADIPVAEVARLTRASTSAAMDELAARFDVSKAGLEAAYDELKQRWQTAPPPVMPGAAEVVDAVRANGGLNLVVTHRDRRSATDLLRATGIEVDDLLCAPDGHPRKPDPAMYLDVLRRHAIAAADCLAIGDRVIDAGGARAAGMATMFLRTPGLPVPGDLVCDYVVDDLHEALDHLPQPRPE